MKIYIIRHGETSANLEGRLQGSLDIPLNENGIALARETGRAMSDIHFDAVFSSPLTRARQTAELLLGESVQNIPIVTDSRICEINMGSFEGKRIRGDNPEADPVFMRIFFANPFELPPFPGGECVGDVIARTGEFLREISGGSHETVLVSTHGCALRALLNPLYENPKDFWQGHVPYNCSVSIVDVTNGKLRLTGNELIFYDKSKCVDLYAK